MGFYEDAKNYVDMGAWVFPIRPNSKMPLTEHGVKDASNYLPQLKSWSLKWPDAGIAIAGRDINVGDIGILEFDQKPTLSTWAKEYGQPMPLTRTHLSGGKKLPHFVFRQTEHSLALGNCDGLGDYCIDPLCSKTKKGGLHKHEWFSWRVYNRYVIAPPSIHPDTGDPYTVFSDAPILPIPDWLVDALRAKGISEKHAGKEMGAHPVSLKFDFDNLIRWLKVEVRQINGAWHGLDICPAAGYRHEGQNDRSTAFWWDGGEIGFKCHAQGCPSNTERRTNGHLEGGMGCLMRLMQQPDKLGHYDGEIWLQETIGQTLAAFEIDAELQTPEIPAQEIISAKQEPFVDPMDAAWAEQAEKVSPSPLPEPNDLDAIVGAEPGVGLAFDCRALYGKLGEIAVGTKMPLGWAYAGCLAVASALDINDRDGHVRSNLYVGMIAPVGMAKTAVVEAVEGSIFLPDLTKVYVTPSSDRGLSKLIGQNEQRILLIEDEFRAVLGKCAVPNATLAPMICKLWSKDRAGAADKKGLDACSGRLSILGNIPVEDPSDFSRAFGSSTTYGMYSRFLYAYDTQPVKYRPFAGKAHVFSSEMHVKVPSWCWDAKDMWEGDDLSRRRMGEQALRIALVTATVNGDKEITSPCLYAAFRFVEWQLRLRSVFKPGLAETKEAEAFEACYAALLEQHQKQQASGTWPKGADKIGHAEEAWPKFLNFTDVMKHKSYYRKYAGLVTRVRRQMEEEGIIKKISEVTTDENGKPKKGDSTPFVRLCKAL